MRNAISFFKHYRPPLGLSSDPARQVEKSPAAGWIAAVLLLVLGFGLMRPHLLAQEPASPSLPLPGRPAPELAALFVPRHAPGGAYRVAVIEASLEDARTRAMTALAPGSREGDPPGAWTIQRIDPLSAFGEAGTYDRTRVARLYSGKPASVVRAPIAREGRVVASLTLVSPYPDARLERLVPGTLAILFVVDAARPRQLPGPRL